MLDLAQNCKALQHELALALRELNVSFQHDEQSLDVVVTPNEINERHGVGVLLPRIFKDTSAMLVLRTTNLYDGRQAFGSHSVCLNVQGLSYTEILLKIQTMFVQRFPHVKVKRILVIPYLTEDFYVAIALKHLFQAPLCAYMMDDQNIYVNNVPDALVENLIGLSELCLAVSQPLCQAYENKYGKPLYVAPPTVEKALMQTRIVAPRRQARGILIGNIWSQDWLEKLRKVCRESKIQINWFANPNRRWLEFKEELEKDGIFF